MARVVTSTGRVVEVLRELILDNTFPPGARLAETELAEQLGVSRTPVREALRQLAAEALVELPPNRGARVASWSSDELEGVFELRSTLEPRLTGLATELAAEADIAELDGLATRMLAVGLPGPEQDLDALIPLNTAFHGRLVELAGAPAFAAALAGAVRAPVIMRNFHAYDDASMRRSLAHHAEIVAAMRAGDPQWATAVMTAHLRNARAVMMRTVVAPPGPEGG
ncbi:GntR family transcriptional regulator [Frankia sp. AgB1.9]|uniref:GntR family transcriptional regulator n=1 Tax=unclassified Frankia TaxID=2632575 RepID=UPI001933C9C8|nr:GntR family transcriptional regulator [Frankia sp. AgW1.1]MBL7546459.1 GntR family transcriptional regulator [Frankia sp. AgB1.9]MBL7620282.1 GntR family transcriptional regulator [Frankia sp. AgB1.8]